MIKNCKSRTDRDIKFFSVKNALEPAGFPLAQKLFKGFLYKRIVPLGINKNVGCNINSFLSTFFCVYMHRK